MSPSIRSSRHEDLSAKHTKSDQKSRTVPARRTGPFWQGSMSLFRRALPDGLDGRFRVLRVFRGPMGCPRNARKYLSDFRRRPTMCRVIRSPQVCAGVFPAHAGRLRASRARAHLAPRPPSYLCEHQGPRIYSRSYKPNPVAVDKKTAQRLLGQQGIPVVSDRRLAGRATAALRQTRPGGKTTLIASRPRRR
jgi:hypothetical protein